METSLKHLRILRLKNAETNVLAYKTQNVEIFCITFVIIPTISKAMSSLSNICFKHFLWVIK